MNAIRQRLLLGLLAGLSLVLAASGFTAYRQARSETNALFDYQLQQTALALRNQNLLALAMGGDSDSAGDLLVQIWDRSRGLLYVSQRDQELPFSTRSGFNDLSWRDRSWRLFALHAGDRIVQVAQPSNVRLRMSADIAFRNLAPFLLLLPGTGLVVWFGVGAGLRPLHRLAAAIQRRHPTALEPVGSDRLPAELIPLVHALNDLLARLGQALDNQRRFVADAAHELRTPLTAVRLQADLARRAGDAESRNSALRDLDAGLQRAAHSVEQLLVLARLDAEPAARFEPVDLLALAKAAVAEQSATAEAEGLDLGLLAAEPASVAGDPGEMRVLLDNLVDNALRYTPRGGRIDVGIQHAAAEILLWVRDTGPGIPMAERERVFDRFYRGVDAGASGSGLGLAIVKRIALRHNARIELSDLESGSGLQVTVRFSRPETVSRRG